MNTSDIIYQILGFLELKDTISCSTINKLFNNMCDLQYVRFLDNNNDYKGNLSDFLAKNSHKQSYIICYTWNTLSRSNICGYL